MPIGRPRTFEIALTPETRAQLEDLAHSRSLPAGLVRRAQVILLSATGLANREIGATVQLSGAMVGHWRRRFRASGIAGLYDAPRSGRPRTHDDDAVARLLRTVLPPSRSTPRTGVRGALPRKRASAKAPCSGTSRSLGCSPTAARASNSRPTRSSSRRSATSSASISIHPITRWCCPSMRRARFRRSSGRNEARCSKCWLGSLGYGHGANHKNHRAQSVGT